MADQDMSVEALNSLAEKIDSLELTEAEQGILDTLIARAAAVDETEVSGFYFALDLDGVQCGVVADDHGEQRLVPRARPLAFGLGLTNLSDDNQFP